MEETMKDYEKELEASFRTIQEGDVISKLAKIKTNHPNVQPTTHNNEQISILNNEITSPVAADFCRSGLRSLCYIKRLFNTYVNSCLFWNRNFFNSL